MAHISRVPAGEGAWTPPVSRMKRGKGLGLGFAQTAAAVSASFAAALFLAGMGLTLSRGMGVGATPPPAGIDPAPWVAWCNGTAAHLPAVPGPLPSAVYNDTVIEVLWGHCLGDPECETAYYQDQVLDRDLFQFLVEPTTSPYGTLEDRIRATVCPALLAGDPGEYVRRTFVAMAVAGARADPPCPTNHFYSFSVEDGAGECVCEEGKNCDDGMVDWKVVVGTALFIGTAVILAVSIQAFSTVFHMRKVHVPREVMQVFRAGNMGLETFTALLGRRAPARARARA
jgi:hypothetical protein